MIDGFRHVEREQDEMSNCSFEVLSTQQAEEDMWMIKDEVEAEMSCDEMTLLAMPLGLAPPGAARSLINLYSLPAPTGRGREQRSFYVSLMGSAPRTLSVVNRLDTGVSLTYRLSSTWPLIKGSGHGRLS